MTNIIPQETVKTVQVPLTELKSLKDTDFVLPTHATRDIDTAHVLKLSETDASKWPPLKVVATDEGLVIIDGYHREKALRRQTATVYLGHEGKSERDIDKALENASKEPELSRQLEEAYTATTILVEVGTYKTVKAVAFAALTANLTHGRGPDKRSSVSIAVDIYDLTRGEDPEPSQSDIARMVGISRATLNEKLIARERKEKEEAKKQETAETPEGVQAVDPQQEINRQIEQAKKKAENFLKVLQGYAETNHHAYDAVIELLFPHVFDGIANIHVESTDVQYMTAIRAMLSQRDTFNTGNIPHIERFGKVVTSTANSLKKTHGMLPTKEPVTTSKTVITSKRGKDKVTVNPETVTENTTEEVHNEVLPESSNDNSPEVEKATA